MSANPKISIVIPVYNEEATVREAMRRLRAFFKLKGVSWECVIADDGSTDRTREFVLAEMASQEGESFLIESSPKNLGKGAAVRRGVLAAHGDFILVTDVDLSSPIKESDKLLAALDDGYDIAIGSRAVHSSGADVQQTPARESATGPA